MASILSDFSFLVLTILMFGNLPTLPNFLISFHRIERELFNRLVQQLRKQPPLVKAVIAFWLCLEELGYFELIVRLSEQADDRILEIAYNETVVCLNCILPHPRQPDGNYAIPVLAGFLQDQDEPAIDMMFFRYNREVIYDGVNRILTTICDIIFEDSVVRQGIHDQNIATNQVVRHIGENGSSNQGETSGHSNQASANYQIVPYNNGEVSRDAGETSARFRQASGSSSATLNPLATPYNAGGDGARAPRSQRTMFLTFSHGYPLTREEIYRYFTMHWGDVVEDVVIQQSLESYATPVYARLVLRNSSIIPLILNGVQTAKFYVNGKHLWARVHVPRQYAGFPSV
ncbi:hypothetical protein IFM89_030560 [Coptis chinensis]|uniref:Uncharacterized protein n=1 Tax=Coptis chinensis TaxID=261450 RepID=A0A835HQM7_9MAGN|nr:hypothetical protein IFM89_030560 [Coptis chinensis]